MVPLPPELTQHTAAQCLPRCVEAVRAEAAACKVAPNIAPNVVQSAELAQQPTVHVDAADVVRFDSVALAVLLALRREALSMGQGMVVHNLPIGLQRLVKLYGIDTLLLA